MAGDWKSQLRELKGMWERKGDRPRASVPRRTLPAKPEAPRSSSPVPAKGLPPEAPVGSGQRYNIGIDVGTSTTKVCVRPPGLESSVHVVSLGSSEASTALCPSLVALDHGRLYFGHEAERRALNGNTNLFRHLKMCVACESNWPPQVPSTDRASLRTEADDVCSATFAMRSQQELLWASDLLTLFLAWVMGESRRRLPPHLVGEASARTTYSVSAPVDQIDADSALAKVFGSIAFRAWRLSHAVGQGLPVEDAAGWLDALLKVEPPPEGERLVELCSESSANVAGYFLSPDARIGQYGIVDIGAWTTEISFFRLTDVDRKKTGKLKLAFHAARSHRVAAGEIDDRCYQNLSVLYEKAAPKGLLDLNVIREQRERGDFGSVSIPMTAYGNAIVPCRSAIDFARDVVAQHIRACFHETLGEAYDREKQVSAWERQVHVFLAGGGSLDEILCEAARHRTFLREVTPVPTPKDLEGLPLDDDYRRFLVAYGLASEKARWPAELLPGATIPVSRPQRPRPTPEELGYSGA